MRVLRVFGTMGVWDPPFGAGRLGSWVSGTSCLGPWMFGTSCLGPPCLGFGTGCWGPVGWDHNLGPWVWGLWDQLFGTMRVLDRLFGIVFGTTGVLDHGCLGFGTMGAWDQLGPLCWDYWCLAPWVFGTTVWAWVFWTIGVSHQPLGH